MEQVQDPCEYAEEQLQNILLYHVVAADVSAEVAITLDEAEMANGSSEAQMDLSQLMPLIQQLPADQLLDMLEQHLGWSQFFAS